MPSWITQPKKLGQWPTPEWLIEAALDQVQLPETGAVMDPACGDGRWLEAVRRRNPRLRLIGWDIAPEAIVAARQRLGIQADLQVRDALAGEPGRLADLVVGNPPYVRPQHLAPEQRARAWSGRFRTATDKVDLYAPFVERMLELGGGRLALVLADTWLSLHSYEAFRDLLQPHLGLVAIVPKEAFAATVGTLVLVTGGAPRRATLTRDGLNDLAPLHRIDGVFPLGEAPLLEGQGILGERWRLRMGVVCGSYSEWVIRQPEAGAEPTCRGKDVGRFSISAGREWLRWQPREMLNRRPYVAPKTRALYDVAHKLVLAGASGRQLRAAVDSRRLFPLDSCYLSEGQGDVWALCGLLNSAPVNAWYGARFPAPRVKAVELHRLPWPPGPLARLAEAARESDQAGCDAAAAQAYGL